MRNFMVCILTALTLSVTSAYAGPGGPGHSHGSVAPATEEQVIKNASEIVAALVQKGKIDSSWKGIKPTETKKKKSQYDPEWIVTINNPKIANKEKNTLYVFFSLDGQYLGANFSGI